jgi:uroporphyrinogen decarboxylase
MTHRERFRRVMFYEEFDRVPVWYWAEWQETTVRWEQEGLPRDGDRRDYFNADPWPAGIPIHLGLYPGFPEETIEETDDYRIFRQSDGVVCKDWKGRSSIPHYLEHILRDRQAWPEYKKQLQPDPARIPADFDKHAEALNAGDLPVTMNCAALGGWIRNWMGVEALGYLQHDDPDLFFEMCDTIADLVCWGIDQVLPKVRADMGWGWEDICGRSGPLISPRWWHQCVVPAYKRISAKLRSYGCDLYVVDCDGLIDHLVPGWMEGGVNVMFPVEIGVWKADPMEFRRKYGRELRVIGGINKLDIAKGRAAIDAEIERRVPLMREGGFVPLPDHIIVPETSLADMSYYMRRLREVAEGT